VGLVPERVKTVPGDCPWGQYETALALHTFGGLVAIELEPFPDKRGVARGADAIRSSREVQGL
jgi:hypothetical protein